MAEHTTERTPLLNSQGQDTSSRYGGPERRAGTLGSEDNKVSDASGGGGGGGGGVGVLPQLSYTYSNKAWKGSQTSIHTNDSDQENDIGRYDIHQAARLGHVDLVQNLLKYKKVRKHVDDLDESGMAPLHYAARFNQYEIVKLLVEKGSADPNRPDKTKATPLHFAARKRERILTEDAVNIIAYLSKRGNVNAEDKYKSTPLHFAAMRGNEVVTTALLQNDDIQIDHIDEYGATPLHEAVIYNHITVVSMLITHGAQVFLTDKESITPLHLAAMDGSVDMIQLLLDNVNQEELEKFVNALDKEGNTALHLAVENKNTGVVALLLEKGSNVDLKCRQQTNGSTPLHLAATVRSAGIAQLLLNRGADINEPDLFKASPLHKAAEYGSEDVVSLFLKQEDIEINARDSEYYSPLMMACCYDNPQMVRALLARGADVTMMDHQEKTVLNLASYHDQINVMKVILKHISRVEEHKYIVNAPDRFGNTPLHTAAGMGHLKIVKMLLQCKAQTEAKNEEEETPFHHAAANGQTEVCRLLLEETDCHVLNDEDEDSNTALHLASQAGHLETVKLLISNGADKESRNCSSWTPLDFAASEGHLDIVQHLLSEDVPVNPIDREQKTPLHLASTHGHVDVVEELLEKGADVSEKDKAGRNALNLAIAKGHTEVASAIIASPVWRFAMLNDTYTRTDKKRKITPLRAMIQKTPDIALQVLNRCVETGPEGEDELSRDFYIQFNFELLDDTFSVWDKSGVENDFFQEDLYERVDKSPHVKAGKEVYCSNSTLMKSNHPMMLISKYQRDNLMFHPVTRALLRRKWNIASFFYVSFLLFYCLFLSMLSGYMISAQPPFDVNETACNAGSADNIKSTFEDVAGLLTIVCSVLGIIFEAFQFIVVKSKYLEANNLLDWFTYISSILVVVDLTNCGARTSWQWQLGAFNLLFAWLNMLLFLRRLPWLGIYVIMVVEIFKTFTRFFIVFFLFIVAFAICFYVLLQNQDPFRTPFYSIVKTWVMMIGEMDFGDIFHANVGSDDRNAQIYFEGSTYALFVIFLVLISIIVMNLLTGLAVDDVNQLQNVSRSKKLSMQLELALDVEVAMPYWIQRLAGCVVKYERLYPNRPSRFMVLAFIRQSMEGPLNKEQLCDEILGRHLEEERDENIKELEERVMTKLEKQQKSIKSIASSVDGLQDLMKQLLASNKKKQASGKSKGDKVTRVQEIDNTADEEDA